MKIKELIEILQRYEPEDRVVFEWESYYHPAETFTEYLVKRADRDMTRGEKWDKAKDLKKGELYIENIEDDLARYPEGVYREYLDSHLTRLEGVEDIAEGEYILVIGVDSHCPHDFRINPPLKREDK
jgi:hypothetical protein